MSLPRPELKPIEKEVDVVLKFPEVESLSPPILQLNEVSFSYVQGRPILANVNLGATLESRICIVSNPSFTHYVIYLANEVEDVAFFYFNRKSEG